MNKKITISIIAVVIIFALAGFYFIFNGFAPKCGDGVCSEKEKANPEICPQDCKTPVFSQENPFGSHGNIEIVGVDYKTLADMGVGWARFAGSRGLHFGGSQEKFKATMNDAIENGLKVIVTVKTGEGGKKGECTQKYPDNIESYRKFLREAVIQYKDKVQYYQIENEPEGENFWCDTPENYAKLLRDAYLTIKEACPECKVVIGGATSGHFHTGDDSFYDAVFKTLKTYPECKETGCHDIFDLHTASCDICLDQKSKVNCDAKDCSFSFIKNTYNTAAKLQNRYGFVKPIWSTEFGYFSGGQLENTQISIINSYVYAFDLGYEKIFWRVAEDCCKIFDNGKPTNTYYTYKTLIEKINGYSTLIKISDGQYRFTFSDKNPVYVLWCDSDNCGIPSEITAKIKLTDYLGNKKTINSNDVILTEKPIFIEEIK